MSRAVKSTAAAAATITTTSTVAGGAKAQWATVASTSTSEPAALPPAAEAAFWAISLDPTVLALPPARYVIEMSGVASAPRTPTASIAAFRNWRN